MRVVAGSARGRTLRSPTDARVRPTTDRVRESLFNSLGSMNAVVGAEFVDLFAGTGALGIEGLSRGAAGCTFVESDPDSLSLIEENLALTGLADRARVLCADATTVFADGGPLARERFDVALADPPYSFGAWDDLLVGLPADLAVVESDREITAAGTWRVLRTRTYGTTVVTILESAEAPLHLETDS